jgi:orotate phosphoribosyltransferase
MSIYYACIALDWPLSKGALAYDLYEKGAVKIGTFPVKNRKLSPSPIYFNLRTPDSPTPGPLLSEDVRQIARELFQTVWQSGVEYSLVVGIPHAGEPMAKEFRAFLQDGGSYEAQLFKTGSGESRRISAFSTTRSGKTEKGQSVLLLDDALSGGDTKWEAIHAVEQAGHRVAAVVVLVDREQGGSEALEKRGYKVISVFRLSQLLVFYVLTGRTFRTKFDEIMGYLERSRKIIAAS